MPERRRYTRRQKASAVIAAAASSVQAAAEQQGIPRTTLDYWFNAPEFVALRQKTRDDLAAETMALAHMVAERISERIGEFEPRDLAVLLGILVDKGQLLSGQATSRTEHRDLLDGFDDHERDAMAEFLRRAINESEAVAE